MVNGDLDLRFEEMGERDIPAVTEVMTRAFDDDSQRHLGQPKGGPEGYDNGDFFRTWLLGYAESVGYKVLAGEDVAGAMIVWINPSRRYFLGTIFVDPAWQNKGVGRRMWAFLRERYPEALSWQLETPAWATKNHHFYEYVCGFTWARQEDDQYIYYQEM